MNNRIGVEWQEPVILLPWVVAVDCKQGGLRRRSDLPAGWPLSKLTYCVALSSIGQKVPAMSKLLRPLLLTGLLGLSIMATTTTARNIGQDEAPAGAMRLAQASDAIPSADGAPPRRSDGGPVLPPQALTETILYEFLIAEIAAQRGNIGLSAQAYADLARRTRDPRIARRATELAIFARMSATAVESARIWLETDPASNRALQTLAGVLLTAGRLDESLPYLKKMLAARGADVADVFTQLARSVSAAPDKPAALRLMRQLAQDYPKLLAARLAVVQAALMAGDESGALQELAQARALRPESEQVVLMEAQIVQRRSMAEAVNVLKAYLDRYPGSREVRLSYARGLVSEKRFGEARVEFQRLGEAFPENAEVVFAGALLSLQLGDPAMAEQQLKRLLDLGFRDKDLVRLYLGQIAEEGKRPEEALKWYAEIEPGEQYLPARLRHAQILLRQGKLGEARAWLQDSEVTGTAQRVQLVLAEAQLLRDAGEIRTGFELLEDALNRMPDNPDLLYEHAMLAERIDKLDILESSMKKLISIKPDHAHAYNALGYSFADRNMRLAEARELIERALKLAPDDAFIIDSMGWVLFRQGELEQALGHLKRAYALRPDAEIAAHLAEVLWTMGRQPEAEVVLKEAGDKHPGSDILLKTIQRLKR
jgi:tetratricopeptide (TPR) repeat protein